MNYEKKYLKYKRKYLALKGGNEKKDKQFSVNEPWFSMIKLGLKTVEGRLNKGKFKELSVDDIITWSNSDFGNRTIKTVITRKTNYESFLEYLENEGINKCLPGFNLSDGLLVYRKYYSEKLEKEHGVIALELRLIE